jgi:DNA-binding NtrC family response regulator
MADLLIVDDDIDIGDILAAMMELVGHQVRVARNGEEGLALLMMRKPDLVLLDVEMPVLTGPEMAYRILIHDLGFEKIPLILLSGVLDLPRIAAAVGTPYFLAKPYPMDALLPLIDRALRERLPPTPRAPTRPEADHHPS